MTIVRHLSIDRYKAGKAKCRADSQLAEAIGELDGTLAGKDDVEHAVDQKQLIAAAEAFIRSLPQEQGRIFLMRYYQMLPIREIAEKCVISVGNAKMILMRTRKQLRKHLSQETDVVNIAISDGLGKEIPNLVGKNYWNDVITCYSQSIWCRVTKIEASDYPDGTVLSQSVAPGTPFNKHHTIEPGDEIDCSRTIIEVTIAGSGADLVPVIMPDMTGVVFEDAYTPYHELLEPLYGLSNGGIGFSLDETSTLPIGSVISQYPAPGTPVYSGGYVNIVVSYPQNQTVSLENPVGRFLGDAVDIVRGKGCVPVITAAEQYDPTVPEFTVVRVEPGDLTNIRRGSEVRLIVSVSDPVMVEGF